MKVLIGVIFFTLIFWLMANFSQNVPPHKITLSPTPIPTTNQIIFPTSQDKLILGQTYNLKWTGGGKSPITIFLVNKDAQKQGVSVSLFDRVYNIPNTGSYSYTVPENLPTGLYKFEIGNLNSEYFTIND